MKESKRNRITRAALALFAERGYDATTVPMIVEKAEVGAGTIYRYFENMEALVNTLFQESLDLFMEWVKKDYPYTTPNVKEQFDHILNQMILFSKDHVDTLLFIYTHSNARYLNEASQIAFNEFLDFFRDIMETGKKKGEIQPLPSTALIAIVYGAFMGLIKVTRSKEVDETPELMAGLREACWNAIRIY